MADKLIADADNYVSSTKELSPEAALRLAARLQKGAANASRTDAGLYEVARERVLNHVIKQHSDTVRVGPAKEGPQFLLVRPPRGKRAPSALIAVDHISDDVRAGLNLNLAPAGDEEQVAGLDVRPLDPAMRAAFTKMSSGDCAAAARRAEEEYDYDRSVAAWRLAVLRSDGNLDMVRELVRFLSDIYADYDEIAELLSSPRIDTGRDRALHLRLADAVYQLGHAEEALEHYTALSRGTADALVLRRLGDLEHRVGNLAEAERLLAKSVSLDPGNADARRLLDACRSARGDVASQLLEQAEAARASGDLAGARAICADLTGRGLTGARLARLLAALDAEQHRSRAEELIARAQACAEAAQWREAAKALKAAHREDASSRKATRELNSRVQAAIADENCRTHIAFGQERAGAGDTLGALAAYHRAIETGAKIDAEAAEDALLSRLIAYVGRTRHKITDRHLEGVAAVHTAADHFSRGRVREAETALREARRHLKNDKDVVSLEREIRFGQAQRSRQKADEHVAASRACEQRGDLEGALSALDQAVHVLGADFDDTAERRRGLRASIARNQAHATQMKLLARIADAGQWWRLQREIAGSATHAEDPAIVELCARATAAIQRDWQIRNTAPPKVGADGILNLTALKDGRDGPLLRCLDSAGGRLLLAAGDALYIGDLDTLELSAAYTLPAGLAISGAGTRLFCDGDNVLVFDGDKRELTVISPSGDSLEIADRVPLDKAIPRGEDAEKVAQETVFDQPSGRLLTLLKGQRGRHKGRLLSISTADGLVHNEETFSYAVFNLRAIGGSQQYTVQRHMDLRRLVPSFYNFAVVDARTRIHERPFYPDFGQPMHAIRRIAAAPGLEAPLFCQYWFIEPFTGQVVDHSNGFAQLRSDFSVFYQVSDPDTSWMDDDRTLMTAFAVHDPSRTLVFHTRRYGKKGTHGVAAFSFDGMRLAWDFDADAGLEIRSLLEDRTGGRVYAIVEDAEKTRTLRRIDVENRRLT